MVMTGEEIAREFRLSKSKREQIQILADENVCTVEQIRRILIDNGVPFQQLPRSKRNERGKSDTENAVVKSQKTEQHHPGKLEEESAKEEETVKGPEKAGIGKTETATIPGAKYDNGKPNLSTVPTGIIYAIERVRAYGFAKYKEAENWKSIDPKRWHEAFLRHTLKIWEDPAAIDPESGMPHLWHLACNLDFLIESLNLTPEEFDRRKEHDTCETDTTGAKTHGGGM